MARQYGPNLLSDLRALFDGEVVAGLSDADLLERYTARAIANTAGEAAFAVLVNRHGPMVWGVCRQILGDVHEAEDAFQATFLIVARQAERVAKSGAVGRWIYAIARRVALRARTEARRREASVARPKPSIDGEAEREAVRAELGVVVGEEVARLPARYRTAVELCFLGGLTNEAAARELGWPVGTVKSRLARARKRLRGRLASRGMAPAAVVCATALHGARAAAPAALVRATVQAAGGVTTTACSGTFPESVAVLAMEVIRAMFVKKVVQSVAAIAAMLVAGAGVHAFQDAGRGGPGTAGMGSRFVTAKPVNPFGGALRHSESPADEPVAKVANLVERLARRAAELQEQKKYTEADGALGELSDVVDQWKRRLRDELAYHAYHQSIVGGGNAGFYYGPRNNKNKDLTVAGGSTAQMLQCARCHVHKPDPVSDKEQRLERVEQQLDEILKTLKRRADGEQLPKPPMPR